MAVFDVRARALPFWNVLAFTFRHWRRHAALTWAIGIGVVLSTLSDVLVPVYAGKLVDAVALLGTDREVAMESAIWAIAVMVGLGAFMVLLRHLAFVGIIRLTLRIMSNAIEDAFFRVQRFASDWHANTFAGSIVRKLTRGMWAIDVINDTLLLALLPSLVVLLGSTVLLGLRWPMMGAVVLLGSLIFVAMTVLLTVAYVGPAARLSNTWDTRAGGALADAVSCNPVVKSFGAEWREDWRLQQVINKWRKRTNRTWMRATYNGTSQLVALLILRTAVIGLALWLWWVGQATPGDVAYVLTSYFIIQGYLRDVGMYVRDLQRAINDMEDLVAIHDEELGVADRSSAAPISIDYGGIEFRNVTFRYRGQPAPLYRDLSVRIEAGERVGLVGVSGSGKSTFAKLIQRLYDIEAGQILIDGQDIAACTQASLRSQIAVVQQEPILFHRSLAENIAYGRPNATMDEIVRAAKLANAHDFIAALPRGYGTLVGERGVKLSGGERQRVALARAFLADAPILILDEATSSLDSESEALIQEATERLLKGRTAIVIAHRLSTVRSLKRILIFDQGRIIEEGDHRTLVQQEQGVYRRLFDRQVLGLIDA